MIYRTPTYYRDFRCIAGDCRDSCCKGWEIDIDEDTARYYAGVGGEFGERLRSSIRDGSFLLTGDERCPFLNKSGLCDIYTELGGDKLCRICSDHPRYYEWFGSVKEGGVGLCCEAAAELMISRPFALCEEEAPDETASGDYDEELFAMLIDAREEMFTVLADETKPLCDRLCRLLDIASEMQLCIDMPFPDGETEVAAEAALRGAFDLLSELEPIDEKWQPYIAECTGKLSCSPARNSGTDVFLRRLGSYFIFRYLLKSVFDGEVLSRAKFAVFSLIVLDRLFRLSGSSAPETCALIAKNYSKETEYCEENMEKLLLRLGEAPEFSLMSLKALLMASMGGNMDEF
ncbi:flagellin lysine-N-methylase [Ruminococcus sp.]|uniref:flagellin lysine-N-methylase n=1 Tax=Ruminococcus sp. TaxID=41978 RepID=UPI002C2BD7AF|nr:flagellin lysine-N-methylase [Ruminococcus sp.]HNZ99737.1 flagellin lysine-N-methylase [Ruminococcus sp.]HOH87070.1 flagellin lysine-N-methylase [Ruminococcus sp.]